jgi:hypothetical protein
MRFYPSSALLGVALSALLVTTMSQVSPSNERVWPPLTKHIVNYFDQIPSPFLTIAPGGTHTLYTVPNDRWLVITGARTYSGATHWAEEYGGVLTTKGFGGSNIGTEASLHSPDSCGGPIGWTFRPGSNVVVRNLSVNPGTYSGAVFIGFLTRE